MKKGHLILVLTIAFVAFFSQAQAVTLLQENFSSATLYYGLDISPTLNLGKWVDSASNKWAISDKGAGDLFAQHLPQTSDNTNLLAYGIGLGAIPQLSSFTLDFDYVESLGRGEVILAGQFTGVNVLDPFGGWFPPDDNNDGINILRQSLSTQPGWTHVHIDGIISADFDAIILGFTMGGISGFRGIDNIVLTANANAVPEPATMLLLASGLVGLAGLRRFKKS